MLCLVFSFYIVNKYPFVVNLEPCFSHIWGFCWWFCCLKSPKCNAEVLSSLSKLKKAVTCLMKKTKKICIIKKKRKENMWDKLHSGMNYSTAGCEFSVRGSIIYINRVSLNSNTHKMRLCIDLLMKTVWAKATGT